MNILEFSVRILVCFLLSAIVGLERQYRNKNMGLRTNMLVSLGAFLFNYVTFCVITPDQTRIVSQIVCGIGFLGAGVIIRDGDRVKGLTTAATLWCVAAIGVMTSCGLLLEAIIGTALVLISNVVFGYFSYIISEKVQNSQSEKCQFQITCDSRNEEYVRRLIMDFVSHNHLSIDSFDSSQEQDFSKIKLVLFMNLNEAEDFSKRIMNDIMIQSFNWNHKKKDC